MNVSKEKFGSQLKQLRNEKHFTVRQAALQAGISNSFWSQVENGKRNIPKPDTLRKIAKGLRVPENDILLLAGIKDAHHDDNQPYYALNDKDRRDIAKEIDNVLAGLDSKGEVNFYGEPMSDEDRELFKSTMTTAYEIAKREAKRKFTPKKYRHDSDSVEK